MRLAGRKLLMVVAPRAFRDEEFFVPRELFESLGAQVIVASTRTGGALGSEGGRAVAAIAIDRLQIAEYDAVLVVGGEGAVAHLWPHPRLGQLLREAHAAGKLVAAICLSSVVLARAGIVDGGEVAVWRTPESLSELARHRVRPAAQDVVCAGRVITANGPQAAERWARAIIEAVAKP